ncbi:peroxisome proliferator-activated receptor gamma coactivator-related protein 1 isoform X2 [Echeneis naucrates]|uniref:peroxisome proliferator-activated receptor gamma coactivator-related protein 1 isoform X2 n=1 Tax=Echeneis naucrates TaxID=173247 RepID=UPI0011135943|nr:peroxisome proliferator-activated receptor gamma coactivator-related protein 1-like isoform X2 [Echeneis naucrates]
MWSGKMAARWRGKDGDLNGDNRDFPADNTRNELILSRDLVKDVDMEPQSCADHSILAILEDSTVGSEGKSVVEEENEALLSALSEMLDSGEDDDGTLFPFHVLTDAKLLNHPEHRSSSVVMSPADRQRPRPKSPNMTFTIKSDGEKEDGNSIKRSSFPQLVTQESQTLFHKKSKKADNGVDVFTSTSLVNLVKLMHPYCLKLHVEEGEKLSNDPTIFSKEVVLRYERPTEESDEEINVVSDDEEAVKEAKGKEVGDEKRDDSKVLKSVLVNGYSSTALPCRGKKRVRFGPVQVASFHESVEKALNKKNLTSDSMPDQLSSTKALRNPAGSACEHQTTMSSERSSDKGDALTAKGETKAKSLSLQQYRQLRQRRQPLVEKQGNYTTKWPSVPEPPKELSPILCLPGQRQNSCGPKTTPHCPKLTRFSPGHLHKFGNRTSCHYASLSPRPSPPETKRPRTESKTISPASPLPDVATYPNVNVSENKSSPVKKPILISSDPPNPVLVPLPVSQTASPSTARPSSESPEEILSIDLTLQSTTHLQKIHNDSSAAFPQKQPPSSEKLPVLLVKQKGYSLLQEIKNKLTEMASDAICRPPALCPASTCPDSRFNEPQTEKKSLTQTKGIKLQPKPPQSLSPVSVRRIKCPTSMPRSAQPPSPTDDPILMKDEMLPSAPSSISSPQEQPPAAKVAISDSGIQAPDLTSLLEQFEETQSKEERAGKSGPKIPQTDGHMDKNQPVGSEKTSRLPPSLSVEPVDLLKLSQKTLRSLPELQTLDAVDIPEPMGTEIILSTQQEHPTSRKNPPSKAIQIIDPRPLPTKKTPISTTEPRTAHSSPHTFSSVSCDHDYCGPVDHSLTSVTQRSRAKLSLLKDVSEVSNEFQVTTLNLSAAAGLQTQTSTGQTKSVSRHHSEQPRTRSDTKPLAEKALLFSGCSAASGDGGAEQHETAPCSLPTPPPSPSVRGREKRRFRRRSPHSDSSSDSITSSSRCSSSSSSSSSASRSPKRRRLHRKHSESSSCSSSPCHSISHSPPRHYRLPFSRSRCSRSRSRSWSQSRSRSPSPQICHRGWKSSYSRETRKLRREHEMRIQKLKAIDERRVVYVGRIRSSMTHDELRERFSQFGEVECVSLHFRDRGDHYGFVTFYNMKDAFTAIDNGGKIRKPDELPFDICFGGRRQFCNSHYSDLDANRDADPPPPRRRFDDLDFDSLLKQAQRGLKR